MGTSIELSLEKRSVTRQIDTNPFAMVSPGRASLLRATRLRTIFASLLVAAISACASSPLAFKWADEEGARTKANLSLDAVAFVRNCEAWAVAPGSPLVSDGTLTLSGGGSNEWACFFTRDNRLLIVSPRTGRSNLFFQLDGELRWYAYPNGFWMEDKRGPAGGFFVRFMETADDGQHTANQTVLAHIENKLGLRPQSNPPVRVRIRVTI